MTITKQIIDIARKIARATPRFFEPRGPGEGNKANYLFMKNLHEQLKKKYNIYSEKSTKKSKLDAKHLLRPKYDIYYEKPIDDGTKSSVDLYIPDENTIIEIAMSLKNPLSEFHKDIFKAILAKDSWKREDVDYLVFVAKPKAIKRHSASLSKKLIKWVKNHCSITIEPINEL